MGKNSEKQLVNDLGPQAVLSTWGAEAQ